MGQTPVTLQKFVGLHIQSNSFSGVPDGAFERAENLVVSNDGIVRKRRGFSLLVEATSMTTPRALVEYSSAILVAHNSVLAQVNVSSGALTPLTGAFVPDATKRPRFALANGNLYGTSSTGIRKAESLTTSLLPAGIPPGLDLSITYASTNTGIQSANTQVAYRVVFGRKDVSANKVTGAPSELTAISNTYLNTAATYSGAPGLTLTVTSTAHGLNNGDTVVLASATDSNLNGSWTVAASAANTFQVTVTTSVATNGTVSVGKFRTPIVEFSIPTGLTAEHFYQIFRSTQTSAITVSASDNGQLIYEANLTSGQVSAGYVTFTDDVDELFKGADLYTNPNQSGIQAANFEPPLCDDIAFFKSCLFYANIESKHDLPLALVSVQAADFAAAAYIEIVSGATTHRYIATTTAPTASPAVPNTSVSWNYGGTDASGYVFFQLTNSTSITVATAIAATAKSLAKAINRHTVGLVFGYYTSGPDDIPGGLRFTRRTAGSSFTIKAQTATLGDAFSPELYNAAAGRTSTNTDLPHAVAFSKPGEPEAVPLPYQLLVGAKSSPIQRIIPLRDSLLVLKQDGLWRISGEGPSSFVVTLIDSTIACVAPDSVVALSNQVFFLSTQGVVAATETSAQVLSRPIEAILAPILGNSAISAQTVAIAYESERLYLLSTLQPGSSTADIVYCYNTVTQAWTTWDRTFTAGIIMSTDDRLYALDTSARIIKERKSQNLLDYCDFSQAITCTAVNTTLQTAQFTGASVAVGDAVIKVGSEIINRVSAIDASTTPPTITFVFPLAFAATDACTLYAPITSTLKTTPLTLGDPTVWKMFSDVRLAFRNRATSKLTLSFETDSRSSDATTWTSISTGFGWGYNWGSEWGGPSIATVYPTQSAQECRVLVPLDTSRGMYLQTTVSHSRAAESFELQALSVTSRPFGHRVTR